MPDSPWFSTFGVGRWATTPPRKTFCYETSRAYEEGQDPYRVVALAKKMMKSIQIELKLIELNCKMY
jgi:hypothetical protein